MIQIKEIGWNPQDHLLLGELKHQQDQMDLHLLTGLVDTFILGDPKLEGEQLQ